MLHAENTGRKNSPSAHHRTTLSGYIFATQARIDNRKKNLLNSNISSTCPYGPLAAEIRWRVWGTRANFNGFHVLAALLHDTSSGRQPNFAALNRGRHLCLAGRPSRWALAHISSWLLYWNFLLVSVHTQTDRWKLVSGRENFSCCRSACVRWMK